jgi:hypothetical protein
MPKRPGDSIALGDIIGHPLEPYQRYARIVAIRKDDCRRMDAVIFRLFKDNTERWPSGEYCSSAFICPWEDE